MKKFFKTITSSAEKRTVLENFFSLSFLQMANYILPLITLPYLVRVLGPDKFGIIAFAQAFVQYFVIFTEYGFGLSATREIAVNRSDNSKISKIFSSVTTIKFIFMILSFIVLACLVFFIPRFNLDWLVYLFTFGMVFDNVLFPVWFFQGMEKMKYITSRNIAAKIIFTFAIFVFIRKQSDYIYVPLISSMGYLVTGVFSIWLLSKNFGVRFAMPALRDIKYQIKEGKHIFISMVSINLYTTTNTFILGLFTNNTIVGYFSAGERIIRTFTQLFRPLFQSLYPYISKVVAESRQRAIRNLKKLFLLTFSVTFSLFLVVFIFAPYIVNILLGKEFSGSLIIIRILSPLLFIIPIAHIFANLCLLPFKLDKYFSRIYIAGGVLNIGLLFLFLHALNLSAKGAALANLITEITLTIMMYYALRRHDIKIVL